MEVIHPKWPRMLHLSASQLDISQSLVKSHALIQQILTVPTATGIFGTQEGVHWAKPMVMVPFYSDQFRNSIRCVDAGFAELLHFDDITVASLTAKLTAVLSDRRYTERAQQVSAQFRDNPMRPMDEAMYWIEFVARHRDRFPIFKPQGANIPWYIYVHLDIALALIVAAYLWFASVKYLYKRVRGTSPPSNTNKQKQQ